MYRMSLMEINITFVRLALQMLFRGKLSNTLGISLLLEKIY